MASARNPTLRRTAITTFLHILPLFLLPLSLAIVLLLRLNHFVRPHHSTTIPSSRRKILLTGSPSAALLTLSRIFSNAGHIVIAASPEAVSHTSPLRFVRSISLFRRLGPESSDQDILRLIVAERVDLWIPVEDREREVGDKAWVKEILDLEARRTKPRFACKTLMPEDELVRLCRDELAFAKFVEDMDTEVEGRRVVEVRTRGELHEVLNSERRGRRYVVQRIGIGEEDVGGLDKMTGLGIEFGEKHWEREILPRRTMNETYHRVSRLPISQGQSWVMKELLEGEVHVARALVVKGDIMAFVVTKPVDQSSQSDSDPGSDLLASLHNPLFSSASKFLSPSDPTYSPVRDFTAAFLAKFTSPPSTFLSIAFHSLTNSTPTGTTTTFRPFECSTIPCPQYFNQHNTSSHADAYLLVCTTSANPTRKHQAKPIANSHTTPPLISSPIYTDGKDGDSLIVAAQLPTPPRTPEGAAAKSARETPTPSRPRETFDSPYYQRHPSPSVRANVPQELEVKGVYTFSTTLWFKLVLPLRLLLLQRSWCEVQALMRGFSVVVDRSLNWEAEGWAWEDAGVVVWDRGLLRPAVEIAGLIGMG